LLPKTPKPLGFNNKLKVEMELNSLVFPAPKPSYSHESLAGKLLYIPKFVKFKKPPVKPNQSSAMQRHSRIQANSCIDSVKSKHEEVQELKAPFASKPSSVFEYNDADVDLEEKPVPPLRQMTVLQMKREPGRAY